MIRTDDQEISMSKREAMELANLLESAGYTSLPAALDHARLNSPEEESREVTLIVQNR